MFPQTHIYFAQRVLGRINDAIIIGSIFPDMAIGAGVNRDLTHSSGTEILELLKNDKNLRDFALGNITHGVNPDGLDYYSDESHPPFEKGYCFEKARPLVDATIDACNIPQEMGWWKAHNIIEMGVELRISSLHGEYGNLLHGAFKNDRLVIDISDKMGNFYGLSSQSFLDRMTRFPSVIDLSRATPESLAKKYDGQMHTKHQIRINIPAVAKLILEASRIVQDDLEDFFQSVTGKIQNHLDL